MPLIVNTPKNAPFAPSISSSVYVRNSRGECPSEVCAQVYGAVPPPAARVAEYAAPIVSLGKLLVVTDKDDSVIVMLILMALAVAAVGVVESVT